MTVAALNSSLEVLDLYTVERPLARSHLHAIVATAVLNGLDLVTTKLALDQGSTEANPIAALVLRWPAVLIGLKVLLCAGLLAGALLHREITPRLLAAAWFVTGVYSLVVVLNTTHVIANL